MVSISSQKLLLMTFLGKGRKEAQDMDSPEDMDLWSSFLRELLNAVV